MKKSFLSMILALIMVLSMLPLSVSAAESGWASLFYNIGEGGWIGVYGVVTDPAGNSYDYTGHGKDVCKNSLEPREESFRMFTGQKVKVVIHPDAGKVVDTVTLNGENVSVTDNTFEFDFNEANYLYVTFTDSGWASFFYNIGEGGWIDVYGHVTDPDGNDLDYTTDGKDVCKNAGEPREESFRMFKSQKVKVVIHPDAGKAVDTVTLNGENVSVTDNSFEFDFNEDNYLYVTFTDSGWASFFYNIGEGGWIEVFGFGTDPDGNTYDWTEDGKDVTDKNESFRMFTGQNVKVVIHPDDGKLVDTVTINGEAVAVTNNTVEFIFDENKNFEVNFIDDTRNWASFCYNIGEGGWIEVYGHVTDPDGNDLDYTTDGKDVCKNADEPREENFRMFKNQTVRVIFHPDEERKVKASINGKPITVTYNMAEFEFNGQLTLDVTFAKPELVDVPVKIEGSADAEAVIITNPRLSESVTVTSDEPKTVTANDFYGLNANVNVIPQDGYVKSVTYGGEYVRVITNDDGSFGFSIPAENISANEIIITTDLLADNAPVISEATIKGNAEVGSDIYADYGYISTSADASEYQWQKYEDGKWRNIEKNSTGKSYTITEDDDLGYIRVIVKTKNEAGLTWQVVVLPEVYIGVVEFFVAPDGNDSNAGTKNAPFATVTAARDAMRKLISEASLPKGEVYVNFRGGEYKVSEVTEFSAFDSAPDGTTVVYRSYPGETAIFVGSESISSDKLSKVTENDVDGYGNKIFDRITNPLVRENLYKIDLAEVSEHIDPLKEYSIFGDPTPDDGIGGWSDSAVFVDGYRLTTSRWPNEEEDNAMVKIQSVVTSNEYKTTPSVITYSDPDGETSEWLSEAVEKDMMIWAYPGFSWRADAYLVSDFDAKNKTVTTMNGTDSQPTNGMPLYLFNILEAIDSPGESFIDRTQNVIYFYGHKNLSGSHDIRMSVHEDKMFRFNGASNIRIEGIEMRYTEGEPIVVSGTEKFDITDCIIADGRMGASLSGYNITFKNNIVKNNSSGGIWISGGDRDTLKSSNNIVENNIFTQNAIIARGYSPGVSAEGVGLKILNNEFSYNPGSIILINRANDLEIAYNYIHHACTEAGDMGAIYWGNDPSVLGVTIHDNFFYRISNVYSGGWAQAIFADDGNYGADIYNNVFYQASLTKERGGTSEGSYAFKTHAGQNFNLHNNIFVDFPRAALFQPWYGTGFAPPMQGMFITTNYGVRPEKVSQDEQTAVFPEDNISEWGMIAPYCENNIWKEHYNNTMWEDFFKYFSNEKRNTILGFARTGNYGSMVEYIKGFAPSNSNIFDNNVCVKMSLNMEDAHNNEVVTNNYNSTDFSIFVDPDNLDFSLTNEGLEKVRDSASGFENINMNNMGVVGKVGGSDAPAVENVKLLGDDTAGGRLKLSYTYSDDGDPECETVISWWMSKSEDGKYEQLFGNGDDEIIIPEKCKGYYVKAIVMPRDASGRYGEAVESDVVFVIYDIEEAIARVAEVEQIVENAVIGTEPGNYPADAVTNIKSAIETAKNDLLIAQNQKDVDDAMKAFERAFTVFSNRVVKGGSTDDEDTPSTPSTPSYGGGSGGGGGGGGSSSGNNVTYDGSQNDVTPVEPSVTPSKFVFDDVKGHWSEADVMAMYEAGIVSGVTATTFEPDRPITRAEFATLVAKALKLEDGESDFGDVTVDDWFAPFVGAAAKAGIIVGSDGKFRPNDTITREEMAIIVVKAYEFLGKTTEEAELTFADNDSISDWAKPYVSKAVGAGLISGMGDNMFAPKANATRAQSASLISRLLK